MLACIEFLENAAKLTSKQLNGITAKDTDDDGQDDEDDDDESFRVRPHAIKTPRLGPVSSRSQHVALIRRLLCSALGLASALITHPSLQCI